MGLSGYGLWAVGCGLWAGGYECESGLRAAAAVESCHMMRSEGAIASRRCQLSAVTTLGSFASLRMTLVTGP